MLKTADQLYLDLLKRTICHTIYDPLPVPVEFLWGRRGWAKRTLAPVLKSVCAVFGGEFCVPPKYQPNQIEEGRIWPYQAHSMIGLRRMENLQMCIETALRDRVPGDLIETGVWRGGASIFARGVLAAHGVDDRKVYVADSFAGLPEPDESKYPTDAGDTHHTFSILAVSQQQVEDNFRRYGLLDDKVVFLKGWFADTLPKLPPDPFAVIRLDGDMYGSTMDALANLYSKLSVGGFCIIDDYFLVNCRKAVHDYRDQFGIKEEIVPIDGVGVYWRKTIATQPS